MSITKWLRSAGPIAIGIAGCFTTNLSIALGTGDAVASGGVERQEPAKQYGEAQHKSLWQRLRLAQADSVSPGNQSSDPRSVIQDDSLAIELEEVTVTAQRRAERLQDVPVSVQVLNADILTRQNVTSIEDVSQVAPSLRFANTGRSDNLAVRGIGSTGGQSFDQSVSLFLDDIYHGRSRITNGTFLDLERVEILKGPQSTFFGNNAIAGALSITTRKPTDTFEGWSRALYGEDGQYALEGAVNVPFGERLAMRAAAAFNGSDGWLKNETTGDDQPRQDNMAGRITFLYRISDVLDATMKVEGSKNVDHSGLFLGIADCPPPAPFTSSGLCSIALGLGVPLGFDSDANSENGGQETRLSTSDAVLDVNYRVAGHVLTSTSGFYGYHYNLNLDADVLPLELVHVQAPEHYKQFSQEFRIASPDDQPIEYLAGLYYQMGDLFFRQDQSLFVLTSQLAGIPALAPYLPLGQDVNFQQDEDVYSVFGSMTWNATKEMDIGVGLRGSWVEKDYVQNIFYGTATESYGGLVPLPDAVATIPAFLGVPGTLRGSRSDDAWMPSAKIQYQLAPSAMVYTSYARGFKAGGFNGSETSGVADRVPFGPEYVTAYELGMKGEWFDHRLLLNLAAFYSTYTDLQSTINVQSSAGNFVSLVRNAGEARAKGIELQGQWVITRNLRLATDVTYLDARYVHYENVNLTVLQSYCRPLLPPIAATADPACAQFFPAQSYPEGIPQFRDRSGDWLESPKWSGSLTLSHRASLPGGYLLTTDLSTPFSSDYFRDILDRPTGSYIRVDGRISFESPERNWALDLIGRNLSDRRIIPFYGGLALSPGSTQWQAQQPRNLALQFRYYW